MYRHSIYEILDMYIYTHYFYTYFIKTLQINIYIYNNDEMHRFHQWFLCYRCNKWLLLFPDQTCKVNNWGFSYPFHVGVHFRYPNGVGIYLPTKETCPMTKKRHFSEDWTWEFVSCGHQKRIGSTATNMKHGCHFMSSPLAPPHRKGSALAYW